MLSANLVACDIGEKVSAFLFFIGVCPLVKSARRCCKTLYPQGPRVVPHTHGGGGVIK